MAVQYHYQASSLNQIISGTQDALDRMATLNSKVQSSGAAIDSFNRSDAGQKMSFTLSDWNADFTKVHTALSGLNTKAKNLLRQTGDTSNEAFSTVQ